MVISTANEDEKWKIEAIVTSSRRRMGWTHSSAFFISRNDLKFHVCMIQIYKKNKRPHECYHSRIAMEKGNKQIRGEDEQKKIYERTVFLMCC